VETKCAVFQCKIISRCSENLFQEINFLYLFCMFLPLSLTYFLFYIIFHSFCEKSSNDWPGHSTELLTERSLFSLVPRKVRTTREIGERAPAAVSPAAIAMLRSAHYLRLQPSSSRKEGNSDWQRRVSREFNPKCRKIRSRLPAASRAVSLCWQEEAG